MSSSHHTTIDRTARHRTRAAATGLFGAALLTLGVAATAGAAAAQDTPDDLPPGQPLPSNQVLSVGDRPSGPVSTQNFSARTVSPGVARVSIDSNCNYFNPGSCADDYAEGAKFSWINLANGRSGSSEILADGSAAGSYVDLHTGPGLVAVTVTTPSDLPQINLQAAGGGIFRVG
ncbi:MAG TPA: hypothetical protein H9870_02850 [Candidatus Corynebacterium avicola]|uniref:Uncharacterized protein n=1 Tax=Candidatus Corynebacterium avicola TaxID=2838527 RepID=A0A9D1RN30_9CORY|nr:hypothetical protein [Candidatus Corynebacterium avicola]